MKKFDDITDELSLAKFPYHRIYNIHDMCDVQTQTMNTYQQHNNIAP